MKNFIITLLISSNTMLLGQQISGTVTEKNSDIPVEFVNIGIVGKNIGTVSDRNGKYTLQIKPEHQDDTLRFSSIGYHTYSVKVSDFLKLNNENVSLERRTYDMTEMVVRPKKFKQRTLGITTSSELISTWSFHLAQEAGILINNKNTVLIKEVNLKLCRNSYSCKFDHDSIFLRINIYKAHKDEQFENILINPVLSKQDFKNRITVDLRNYNIVVDNDFLVTFELLENLGCLCFSTKQSENVYVRRASHGAWAKHSPGISISVLVDVER